MYGFVCWHCCDDLNNVCCDLGAYFHLDWKTLELPCNETFQPRVAAVISPSLFYIMNPGKGVYSLSKFGLNNELESADKTCMAIRKSNHASDFGPF